MGIIIPIMGMKKHALSTIFFSKVRQRILALLYVHSNNSFYTNEIIRFASSGNGAVQRELKALCVAGIISVKSIGNQKHYSANVTSPLFTEIQNIVFKTFGLTEVLQDALSPIAAKIKVAFVYGSIAKQEDNVNSDIDLMVISDNLTYADLFILLAAPQQQIGRTINPTFYSTLDWNRKKSAKNNFVIQVIQQHKIFIIGCEDELNKL